ncbi:hypothetical protein TELCIR_08618, partial [Teladorsagia circumcincta]
MKKHKKEKETVRDALSKEFISYSIPALHTGSVSFLNCPTFAAKCKWANTNDEELDWTTLQAVPNPDRFLSLLDGEEYPDPAAGVLTSPQRPGWEGGQLISDPLPCLPGGIRVTATAWKTQGGPTHDQPKLQVCSKNVAEVRFPLVNCNEFDVRNGVPISVEVPAANNPNQPAHIVFYGNNFVSPQGGALFLQDIVVEGSVACNGDQVPNNHPVLINEGETFRRQPADELDSQQLAATYSKTYDPVGPLKVFVSINFMKTNILKMNEDLSCNFWRSAGTNRWEIGSPGRLSNPLTGINQLPDTAQKFLVAPFLDPNIRSYTLVSEALTIPLMETVYFCFYEYLATQGLSLSVCTDRMDCFYRKDTLLTGNTIDDSKQPPPTVQKIALAIAIYTNEAKAIFCEKPQTRKLKHAYFRHSDGTQNEMKDMAPNLACVFYRYSESTANVTRLPGKFNDTTLDNCMWQCYVNTDCVLLHYRDDIMAPNLACVFYKYPGLTANVTRLPGKFYNTTLDNCLWQCYINPDCVLLHHRDSI